MRLNNLIKLFFWLVLFEAIAFLLGLLTQANMEPWYNNLAKSSLTPPGIVFSIVWSVLYAVLAYIGWFLTAHREAATRSLIELYWLQIIINWIWTPLFFQLHWVKLSAIWLIILTGLNVVLAIQARTKQKSITLLLLPYVFWLIFASYLNLFIAVMN